MRRALLMIAFVYVTLGNAEVLRAGDLSREASAHAVAQLEDYLKATAENGSTLAQQDFAAVPLTCEHAQRAQRLLWNDHVRRIKRDRAAEMQARRLTVDDLEMPFYYSVSGNQPESGRSLYISLHGGGGAPKHVNDSQWKNQKRLYHVSEGVYLAPRAPTDTWNMWHQNHIDGMIDRLIENLIVFENVDPNRVYLCGYSAGGDGVYQLAPRMADRFAAASMMAGHPNDASPLGLRNLPFSIHVGGNDRAYNRNNVARDWGKQLDDLQEDDPQGYVHWTNIYEGKGHWLDRQDAAALPWMAKFTRNPVPSRIVWRQQNHARFYWLAANGCMPGAVVQAERTGQLFTVQARGTRQLIIHVDDRMANLDEAIRIVSQGKTLYEGHVARSINTLVKTLAERGDPALVFSGEIVIEVPDSVTTGR